MAGNRSSGHQTPDLDAISKHSLCPLFLIILQRSQRFSCHRIQSDQIEDRHQANAYITQIPYDGVGGQSADKEHHQRQNLIGGLGGSAVSEQIGNIAAGIVQDSKEGGKTEQPQDHCNKDHTELAKMISHGSL